MNHRSKLNFSLRNFLRVNKKRKIYFLEKKIKIIINEYVSSVIMIPKWMSSYALKIYRID